MRCLNCRLDGIPQSTQICPRCGVHLPSLLRDLLPPGTLLRGGDYQIDYPLGRGGFGVTYRAAHTRLEKLVAIKEFYPQEQAFREGTTGRLTVPTTSEEAYQRGLQRFEKEGRTLAKLNHPNVVQVIDFFHEQGTAYLVMELLAGVTLRDELDSQPDKKLTIPRVKTITTALVNALNAVHQQEIYHLDLKPDNVIITGEGRIVLVDFGASRQHLDMNPTRKSTYAFTEAYAAPEVIAGREVGAESDLFELGMILHEMLTGTLPPSALNRLMKDEWFPDKLDEPWQGMVIAALQLQANFRPKNVQQWWATASQFEQRQPQNQQKPLQQAGVQQQVATVPLLQKDSPKFSGAIPIVAIGVSALSLGLLMVTNAINSNSTSQPTPTASTISNSTTSSATSPTPELTPNIAPIPIPTFTPNTLTLPPLPTATPATTFAPLPTFPTNNSQPLQLSAGNYVNRGLSKHNKKDYQGAIDDYNQALILKPNYSLALYNRGVALDDTGDKQGAIADYTKAIQTNKDWGSRNLADAYYNRGIIRKQLGNKLLALSDFNQAIIVNPKFTNAYIIRGNTHKELGNKQTALKDYHQAVNLDSNSVLAYYNRGLIHYLLGNNRDAIDDYSQTIRLNSQYTDAYYNRGLAHSKIGNKADALADFRKSAQLYQQAGNTLFYQDARDRIKELE
ncbi:serine/threonine-protein kinase [Calothrix sp. UHCC 0171]|uniref:serine/threonine-protein kinase n=1 Tax=Calothrix sp. UHCC 0171 TaxID=3110245 RepID=UPI002B21EBB4|nr:serine/threonine-protein kinase [Calothrix sp. UHCC 0171]MEA5570565.1 serine/threonine-protein kinase [Calothrix sp. UHCC 0171]